jgi:hypothetical protein
MRNEYYADYKGIVEEEDQEEAADMNEEEGPWTTVGRKGKNIQ